MNLGWRELVAVAAVLFMGFLVVKMRPSGRRRSALGSAVRAARERAHAAATPRARAEALCDAGELAVQAGARWTAAAGFFLRAMNADPGAADLVERTVAALRRRRARLLEQMLWRRLSHLPWDAAHGPALRASASGLASIYGREIRDAVRAEVLQRMARTIG